MVAIKELKKFGVIDLVIKVEVPAVAEATAAGVLAAAVATAAAAVAT